MPTTKEPASQICLLVHQLATSDPPCAISSCLYPIWQLDPSWSLVYLGTKVQEQMRKPDSLSFPGPVLYSTLGPAPSAPSGAIPATFLSQEGLAGGGGEAQCPVFTAWAGTRGKQSPASGSLRTTVHLPASPGPPAFCSQGEQQGFPTWRVLDEREPSRLSRSTPS